MKAFLEQFSGLFGASIAAACCLGLPAVLTVVGAAGLGFLIHDAYLFPIFVGFVSFSLWLLFKSARSHANLQPFWLSLFGGVVSSVALWLMVTGLYPVPWVIYIGLGVLVAGSIWDVINGRRAPGCAAEVCETPKTSGKETDPGRRAITGAALSASAAVAFYGMYKSVDMFAQTAESGDIACWGINACKGTTACSTAHNACTGQNECRSRGYNYVPAKECYSKGGVPLTGSDADPAKG